MRHLLLAFLILIATPAWAATYYVTPTGNDTTGDGSVGAPWATLSKACNTAPAGNSTTPTIISVAAGSYTDNTTCTIKLYTNIVGAGSGTTSITTSANPYINASTTAPVVDGGAEISGLAITGSGSNVVINSQGRNNVKVFSNAVTNGNLTLYGKPPTFYASGSGHPSASWDDADPTTSTPPLLTDWATGVQVYSNTFTNANVKPGCLKGALIHDNVWDNTTKSCLGNTSYYFDSSQVYNNTFTMTAISASSIAIEIWQNSGGTRYYNNTTNGWFSILANTNGSTSPWSWEIDNNTFSSNISGATINYALESGYFARNVAIHDNYFTNSGANLTYKTAWGFHGRGTSDNIRFHNNVIYNLNSDDITLSTTNATTPYMAATNIHIYNNVIDAGTTSGHQAIYMDGSGPGTISGVYIKNNAIVGRLHGALTIGTAISSINFNYNLGASPNNTVSGSGFASSANNIDATPGFTGSGSRPAAWYAPVSGGNLIDAGVDVGLEYTGSAPEIGAYEVPAVAPAINIYKVTASGLASVSSNANIAAHVNDPTAAHAASAIGFTPTGSLAATDVQAMGAELDSEKTSTANASNSAIAIPSTSSEMVLTTGASSSAHNFGGFGLSPSPQVNNLLVTKSPSGTHSNIHLGNAIYYSPSGSGVLGNNDGLGLSPLSMDAALGISAIKQNWSGSPVEGEVNGLYVVQRNGGAQSDGAGILVDVLTYDKGTGGANSLGNFNAQYEGVSQLWSGAAVTQKNNVQLGIINKLGGGGIGVYANQAVGTGADAFRATSTDASNKWTNGINLTGPFTVGVKLDSATISGDAIKLGAAQTIGDGTNSYTLTQLKEGVSEAYDATGWNGDNGAATKNDVRDKIESMTGSFGEANTASNLGTGEGVFAQKSVADLQFKSLKAGTGISVSSTSTEITIAQSGAAATLTATASEGSNLITNGTFNSGTDWTTTSGWTIGSGVASHSSGTTDLTHNTFTSTAGTTYKIIYTVSGTMGGGLACGIPGTGSPLHTVAGTYTRYYTAPSTSLSFSCKPATDFVGSVDDISVVAVTGGDANIGPNVTVDADGIVTATAEKFYLQSQELSPEHTVTYAGNVSGQAPTFNGRRARGSLASPSATQSGDLLFNLGGIGYGATAWQALSSAYIRMTATEAFTDSAKGARISFATTTTGTTSRAERMAIENDGKVGIGTTGAENALDINSATGANLQLTYNDSNGSAANKVNFAVSSSGDLTVTPSGGDMTVAGVLTATNLMTKTVTLSDNVSTELFRASASDTTNASYAFKVDYLFLAFNGTDQQSYTGTTHLLSTWDEAGGLTQTNSTATNPANVNSSGAMTCTFSRSNSSAAMIQSVTCDTDLTGATVTGYITVHPINTAITGLQ